MALQQSASASHFIMEKMGVKFEIAHVGFQAEQSRLNPLLEAAQTRVNDLVTDLEGGQVQHHRREELCRMSRVLQCRWMKARLSLFAALFDQSNAFNSIGWVTLEDASMKDFDSSDNKIL